jgi:hypothetical protein
MIQNEKIHHVVVTFVESKNMEDAKKSDQKMKASGLRPSTGTYNNLIKCYGIVGKSGESIKLLILASNWESPCLFNIWLLIIMTVFTLYFEQWDPGGYLNMFTPARSYRLKQ